MSPNIAIDRVELAAFCHRHSVRRLAVFGSALREDFGPHSDIDVLVEFEPGRTPGLAFFAMQDQLSGMFGRVVDLIEDRKFSPPGLEVLKAPSRPEGKTLFAQDVCLNCDARFGCASYRQLVRAQSPGRAAGFHGATRSGTIRCAVLRSRPGPRQLPPARLAQPRHGPSGTRSEAPPYLAGVSSRRQSKQRQVLWLPARSAQSGDRSWIH